jgi:capsular exopolysaccharide synthesis family protein
MELRHYLHIAWKWSWLVVLAVLIAGGASYFASKSATPLYRTKTTLMIGRAIENPDPRSVDLNTGQQLAHTYSQLARREPILAATIERLGLRMSWQNLAGRVSTNVVPQTQLLEIFVVDSDPLRAKVLADAIAEELIRQSPTTPDNSQEQLAFTQAQIDDLKSKIERGQKEINRLTIELDSANSSRLIQDLQNKISIHESKISGWQNTYSQLLTSVQGGNINFLRVVEVAARPSSPFSPNVSMNVMLASVIGLVLAVGGIFLIEYLDDTVKTSEDVRRASGLPTLGLISRISGKQYPDKLIALRQPLSPIVEGYRVLRTNLLYASPDKPLKTIMVTSPNAGEGKSVTLANLAVVIAQSGRSVILVDTDMRRPVVHTIFSVSNRRGLSDAILESPESVFDFLQDTGVQNLRVLCSGGLPPNPPELLGSSRMKEVIDKLKSAADVVLFDSPPAQVVSDALILGPAVDGVLLIHDVGSTRTSDSTRVSEDLKQVRVNILGIVLNRMKRSSRNSYYYEQAKSGKTFRTGRESWFKRPFWFPRHFPGKTSK